MVTAIDIESGMKSAVTGSGRNITIRSVRSRILDFALQSCAKSISVVDHVQRVRIGHQTKVVAVLSYERLLVMPTDTKGWNIIIS